MIYNSSIILQRNQAIEKFKHLVDKGKTFELRVIHPKRSISQNNYLHLIITWFSIETGYTFEEAKQDIFKKHINSKLFYNGEYEGKIEGVVVQRWRSTSSLDVQEMTLAIDRFRNFSSKELGIYLPEPRDLALLQELENEISKHKNQQFI